MTEIQVWPVDPRDQRWEVWSPRFRVSFWRLTVDGWASREFELAATDVVAVLEWVKEHAEPRETSAVYCVVDGSDGRGLVRLAGNDPTRT